MIGPGKQQNAFKKCLRNRSLVVGFFGYIHPLNKLGLLLVSIKCSFAFCFRFYWWFYLPHGNISHTIPAHGWCMLSGLPLPVHLYTLIVGYRAMEERSWKDGLKSSLLPCSVTYVHIAGESCARVDYYRKIVADRRQIHPRYDQIIGTLSTLKYLVLDVPKSETIITNETCFAVIFIFL